MKMKRIAAVLIFALFALSLLAQDGLKVEYKGDRPTISDFASAIVASSLVDEDDEECEVDESSNAFNQAWLRYSQGLPQEEGNTLTVDQRNGFVLYESVFEESKLRVEMCFWNEADQAHKIIAYNVSCFMDDEYSPGQFDGLVFYRYDNASKTMTWVDAPGFEVEYGTEDGAWVCYDLPRTGKDITVNYWKDGGKKQKILKWNGSQFNK